MKASHTKFNQGYTLLEAVVGAALVAIVAGLLSVGVTSIYKGLTLYGAEAKQLDDQQRIIDYLTIDAWNASSVAISSSTVAFTVPRTYEVRRASYNLQSRPNDSSIAATLDNTANTVKYGTTDSIANAIITYTINGSTLTRRAEYTSTAGVSVDQTITLTTSINASFATNPPVNFSSSTNWVASATIAPLTVTLSFIQNKSAPNSEEGSKIIKDLRPRKI